MKTNHTITLPDPQKAPINTGNIIVWIFYFLSPFKMKAWAFFFYRLIRYTWLAMLPLMFGFLIDGLDSGAAQDNPEFYAYVLIGYMAMFSAFLYNMIFVPEVALYEKAARALTLFSIGHLNSLSLNWHEAQGSGGKLQRVMTGRRGFQELTRHLRWDVFPLIGGIVAVLVTLLISDIPALFGFMYIGFIGTYLLGSWYFARPYLALYNNFNEKFEKLLSGVYEFVSAIRTVKAFHLNSSIIDKAQDLEVEGQEAVMSAFSANLMRWTICNIIAAIWLGLFAWLGFQSVLSGAMTTGVFATVFFLAYSIWGYCEMVAAIWEKIYEHGNGIYRLVETLRITPKQLDVSPTKNLPKDWKSINLQNMSFTYGDDELQGVHDIDLNVQRGEKVAFIGESGAGKSTLVKLLMKQMLPTNGWIAVDDTNLNHTPSDQWLNEIGFVPQDVELFNLTIRDNILIDRVDTDQSVYEQALEQAALKDFIDSLPEKDQTIIGERGIKLSGGQRQRLGIARALVRQSEIIIFDEATSSLDSLSEQKIQNAMENSFSGHTVFLVAHRLSTVRHVDKIIVLEKGRIVEQGHFEELIAKKGTFARLWDIQSKAAPQKIEL